MESIKPCTVLDLMEKKTGKTKTAVVVSSDAERMNFLMLKDKVLLPMSYDHAIKNLSCRNVSEKLFKGVPMAFVFWCLFYVHDHVEYSEKPFLFRHRIMQAFYDEISYKELYKAITLSLYNITTVFPKCGSGEHTKYLCFVWWDGKSKQDIKAYFPISEIIDMYEKYILLLDNKKIL